VIRVANFGWNLAAKLKIDGQTVANIVPGSPLRSTHPGRAACSDRFSRTKIHLSQPTSITLNVRLGGTYIFTALWDSEHVYLQPTTLSSAEIAKLRL
jgi:hypothetical protein